MRVLLVHLSDGHKGGGGGIAALRLHLALRKDGVDSRIMCRNKTGEEFYITEIPRFRRLEYVLQKVSSRMGLNDIHLVGSFKVKEEEVYKKADIIDFQGIHTQTLSYFALPYLTKNKPAVFTMHDQWALTGHCAYSFDCERWQIGCGLCPYLDVHPAVRKDATRFEWRFKRWAFSRSNMVFVAPSKWLCDQFKKSMPSHLVCYLIPNGIDTGIYRPLGREKCRREMGLPLDKKILMFSAIKLSMYRKGGDLLLNVLSMLPSSIKSKTALLTVGQGVENVFKATGMKVFNLGYVEDDHQKAMAYSAADLFLFPTRADNHPLVLLESMACGTPMVSFRIGGVPEIIRPGATGYLADPEDVKGFHDGVIQLVENDPLRDCMAETCRTIAIREYQHDDQVRKYLQLYEHVMRNGAKSENASSITSLSSRQ